MADPLEKGFLAPELQELLERDYNTPNPKWQVGLGVQFKVLQSCLETKTLQRPQSHGAPDTAETAEFDADYSPSALSPSAANAAALPVIKLMFYEVPIANNEYMPCAAFGTVSPERFRAIFWETVERRSDIKVYEDSSTLKFQFGDYYFKLCYHQWADLVRHRPKILNAEMSFLDSRKNQIEYLAVLQIQECHQRYNQLTSKYGVGVVQSAYYYLRAWSIERGLFFHPRLGKGIWRADCILKMIAEMNIDDVPLPDPELHVRLLVATVFLAVVQSRLPSCDLSLLGSEPRPERGYGDLLSTLKIVKALPLRDKLNMPYCLKIDLVTKESSITKGQWFRLVEESIPGLEKVLSKELAATRGTYRVWPSHLLLGPHPEASDMSESCYAIGIRCPETEQLKSNISAGAGNWLEIITKRGNEDIKRPCYISVTLLDRSQFGDDVYSSATRHIRHEAIPNPSGVSRRKDVRDGQQKLPRKKENKRQLENVSSSRTANEPTNKLKEVSAILKRLRTDSTFDIDDFKVGYLDRFKGIQEKPAASWQTEKTHQEFIPESRIEYIKKLAEGEEPSIMWHKKEKIDLFSYTGNSTRE